MNYTIWQCNGGGLWLFTKKDENPPDNSHGVPVTSFVTVIDFEAEEDRALEVFFETLPRHLPKHEPPTIEWCLKTIADRGVDESRAGMITSVASPEELLVSLAAQRLGELRVHHKEVESLLEWVQSDTIIGRIRGILERWDTDA